MKLLKVNLIFIPLLALCLGADVRVCGESASFGNAAIRIGLSGAEMGMQLTMSAVTMPNMPVEFSAWVRMWQCQAQIPASVAWTRTV